MRDEESNIPVPIPEMGIVTECANLSQSAYEINSIKEKEKLNCLEDDMTFHFHAKNSLDTSVMVLTSSFYKCVFIVFRGSSGVKNWLVTSSSSKVVFGSKGKPIFNTLERVHEVFNNAFFEDNLDERIETVVNYLLFENPEYAVIVTGHNFGAGLSILCGAYLSARNPNISIAVINFACPKIVGYTFQKRIDEDPNLWVWRFVFKDDSICYYPLSSYFHVGYVIQLYSLKADNLGKAIEDENYEISDYVRILENLEKEGCNDIYVNKPYTPDFNCSTILSSIFFDFTEQCL